VIDSLPILAAGGTEVEAVLLVVLVQLCVIIAAARVFGTLFRWLGQPTVVGEILAGLILGPSVFGHFFPDLSARVFDHSVDPIFRILSQLGLIFLLFLIGLEFDFRHLRTSGRSSLAISVVGIVLPFGLGWWLAFAMHPHIEHVSDHAGVSQPVDPIGFALFMGTAMSITAIPILGRIMLELNIHRSRLGVITITAAAVDDAIGWIILAAVSALVRSAYHPTNTLLMLGETVGFALGMVLLVKPLLARWARYALRRGDGELGLTSLAILIVLLFLCAIATNLIGIFAIFGAFILGATLSGEEELREVLSRYLRSFVTVFFLPIFFTYTGLRTDIGTLHGALPWLFAAAVSAVAIVAKFGGCTLAAMLSGHSARESACIGVMMNTRALMELIVINVGYELGVIPRSVFCMLVIMAVLTTVMTTPLLMRLARHTELEPLIEASGFLRRRPPPLRDASDRPATA
jgi:Kef-type K+ transport system membrane component KefB